MYADCLAQGRGWGGGRGGCWRVGAVSNTKITAITSEFNTIVNHNRSLSLMHAADCHTPEKISKTTATTTTTTTKIISFLRYWRISIQKLCIVGDVGIRKVKNLDFKGFLTFGVTAVDKNV